jgi:hypothetical protein
MPNPAAVFVKIVVASFFTNPYLFVFHSKLYLKNIRAAFDELQALRAT